jgi:hypothetical protein
VPDREVTDDLIALAVDRPQRRAAVRDRGVPLDIEEVGGTQMAIPLRVAGVDARRIDGHLHARVLGPLGDVQPPLELAEVPAYLRDHHVPRHELDVGVRGVDVPPAHGRQLAIVDEPRVGNLGFTFPLLR